ncbi:phage holin family protein [Ginsengibacter hankyongi]|uniref:Phage holin family protein n=1 Tax=Ginsengibacter hankyongi TaxID=2607284 RepID=A0A5J5IMB4_9BACT|nr:phage holin family protein [Ginsengibacter hankyongi]KAA9042195.1 phage holin family protein [Ginsengibacter hankyongi]
MESKPTNVEDLYQKLSEYADVRINLFKLKSINKISGFMSSVVTIVILIILFGAVLLCLTVGAGFLIGEWVGKVYYGFFIVGAIYLIIGLVIYSMRDKLIKTKVSNKLIKDLLD